MGTPKPPPLPPTSVTAVLVITSAAMIGIGVPVGREIDLGDMIPHLYDK